MNGTSGNVRPLCLCVRTFKREFEEGWQWQPTVSTNDLPESDGPGWICHAATQLCVLPLPLPSNPFHLSIMSPPFWPFHPVHMSLSKHHLPSFNSCHKFNLCNVRSLLFHLGYTIDPKPIWLCQPQQPWLQSQSFKCPYVGNTQFHL